MKKFRPIMYGFINALIPGLGYVLIGRRVIFGALLLAGSICCIILAFVEPAFMSRSILVSTTSFGKFLESLWYFFFLAAYGYDAYTLQAEKEHESANLPMIIPETSQN